jgi:protein-disulfide isomerase
MGIFSSAFLKWSRLPRLAAILCALAVAATTQTSRPAHPPGKASHSNSASLIATAYVRGPAGAPVTIVEFTDFMCPFCASMAPVLNDLRTAYPTQVRIIFKNSPLSIHAGSALVHEAAMAAAEQGKFWEMHDLIFAHQKALTRTALDGYARQLGLDMKTFENRLDTRYYQPMVERDVAEAQGFGIQATPTFFINGRKLQGIQTLVSLKNVVDAQLHPRATPSLASAQRFDNISTENAPVRGPRDAKVKIIEFSDMQCPFCQRTVSTMRQVVALYPDNVVWIFKHFPLSFHPDSMLAHQALAAANQQGKFWEMHDLIFANQQAMKRDDLLRYAKQLGLDEARFHADLEDPKLKAAIEADRQEGLNLGITGTPTFFVNGEKRVGGLSLETFQKVIDQALMAPNPSQPGTADPHPATVSGLSSGPATAPVEIIWYADLESPLTPKANSIIVQLMDAYPGKVRVVEKNFPLKVHTEAWVAHEAVLAANAQGKGEEMQAFILSHQQAARIETLTAYAGQLGLRQDEFEAALKQHKYKPIIERDLAEAQRNAVSGSPVFFINGQRIDGLQPLPTFTEAIDEALHRAVARSN